jgi:hypothetical protein
VVYALNQLSSLFCVSSGFCSVFGDSGWAGTFFVSALIGVSWGLDRVLGLFAHTVRALNPSTSPELSSHTHIEYGIS